jgi:hypothetical protein
VSTQSVFDMLGLCELRDHGAPLPRRHGLAFANADVVDDGKRTRVVPGGVPGVVTRLSATIGDGDWSSSILISGDGGDFAYRVYDMTAGDWFGRGADFSSASVIELKTALANPDDIIVITGLPPTAAAVRKAIINHGPSNVSLSSPQGAVVAGSVRSVMSAVAPQSAAALLLDPTDQRWIARTRFEAVPAEALVDDDSEEPLTHDDDFLVDG